MTFRRLRFICTFTFFVSAPWYLFVTALTNLVNQRSHALREGYLTTPFSYQHNSIPYNFQEGEENDLYFTVAQKCTPYFTPFELVLSNTILISERLSLDDVYERGKQLISNSALLHVDSYHSSYQLTQPKIRIELPQCRANNYPNFLYTYIESLGNIYGSSYINLITQEATVQLNSGLPTTQLVEAYKGMEEYVQSVHKRVFSRDFMPFQLHLHNSLICTQINVKSEADRTKGTSYIMLFKGLVGHVHPIIDENETFEKGSLYKKIKPYLFSVEPLFYRKGTFSDGFSKDTSNAVLLLNHLVQKGSKNFDTSSFVCSEEELLNQPFTMNHCISFDPISQLFFQENIPEETFWAQCSALIPVNSIAVYDKECENELNDDNGNCVTKPLYRTCTAAGWSESKMVDPNDTKLMQRFGACKKARFFSI